jgi:hypothetical protein
MLNGVKHLGFEQRYSAQILRLRLRRRPELAEGMTNAEA